MSSFEKGERALFALGNALRAGGRPLTPAGRSSSTPDRPIEDNLPAHQRVPSQRAQRAFPRPRQRPFPSARQGAFPSSRSERSPGRISGRSPAPARARSPARAASVPQAAQRPFPATCHPPICYDA